MPSLVIKTVGSFLKACIFSDGLGEVHQFGNIPLNRLARQFLTVQ